VALSQARILYQNHSGDYPQVILTIPVTCRTMCVCVLLLYIEDDDCVLFSSVPLIFPEKKEKWWNF
jgi:hypothetical protein